MFEVGSGSDHRLGFRRSGLLWLLLVIPVLAFAQGPIVPSDEKLVSKFLDQESLAADHLKCEIKPQHPMLDFAFRFDVGYLVRCPVREFAGRQSTVLTFLRITPERGQRKVFGEAYVLPGLTEQMKGHTDLAKLRDEFDFSGGFSAGEGTYWMDVLLVDKQTSRMCRKSWKVSVVRKHAETKVPMAIADDTAMPMTFFPWTEKVRASANHLRLTVLLDAAPVYPYSQKLRAWDRSFLLSTLSTLLDQMDCASVRVVAFNLDQQKEIFRDHIQGQSGLIKLNRAMRDLELGKVSYQILQQQQQGGTELLARLASGERSDPELSDLVVVLGPHTRFTDKIPSRLLETLSGAGAGGPQFFYLEYMPFWLRGAEFADNVEQVTKALGGKSFKIYSPADLARAIERVVAQVRTPERSAD